MNEQPTGKSYWKDLEFCMVLDGLFNERTRLTAMKVLTNYSDTISSVLHFVVKRELAKNFKRIEAHYDAQCAMCEIKDFADKEAACVAYERLAKSQLTMLQDSVKGYLRSEGFLRD